jgi:pimeloyl-ACP methyl ester carboxylesterase
MKWQFKFWGLWTLTALSSPLLLTWTFFGWIWTSSPRICAVVSFILSSYLIGIASLYDTYLSLISQYLSFLLLFLYCFIYRSTTRLFRFAFLSLILLFQTSQLLSLHFVQYAPSRITLASDLTLFVSLNIVVVLLNLWLPASEMKFLQVEEQFLQSRCDRKLIRILVASLGTIQVTDEVIDDTNREEDLVLIDNTVSKPILVLLHGYGGYNAQWADCLSKLQTRSPFLSHENPDQFSLLRFQVYCVELYGFGRSSRVPWGQRWEAATLENSLDAMTSALEKWRETLQISRFILVTHSLSCYVGITYLLKYPGFVSHLYLTSPIGLNSTFSSYSPLNYRCQRTNSIYSPLHEVDQEVSKQELCGGTSCWSSRSISQILWENNFTPMDFLRWLGPLGEWREFDFDHHLSLVSSLLHRSILFL